MQPFASSADFQDSLSVFISEFTGGSPGAPKVVQASVNVLSFGAGSLVGQPVKFNAEPPPADPVKFLTDLQYDIVKPRSAGASFPWDKVPWSQLIAIAIQLLQKYLPFPVVPAPAPFVT